MSQFTDDMTEISGIFNMEFQKEIDVILKYTIMEYIEQIAIAMTQFQLDEDRRLIMLTQASKQFKREAEESYELMRDQYISKIKSEFLDSTLLNLQALIVYNI